MSGDVVVVDDKLTDTAGVVDDKLLDITGVVGLSSTSSGRLDEPKYLFNLCLRISFIFVIISVYLGS